MFVKIPDRELHFFASLIMRKILFFPSLLFIITCQTPANRSKDQSTIQTEIKSIVDKSFITLGSEQQYVEITGASIENPVLLFLHGGPGWPQTPQLRYFNENLTKSVTLVAWEQSGSGQSYMNNSNPKNLSLDQIIYDAHELTLILKKKFNKDKIYLAGFSWGSIIGLRLALKYPQDYSAYFGISQVIGMKKSIKLSRAWIRDQAKLKQDDVTLQMLSRIENGDTSICKRPLDCFLKQYELLSAYGGAIYNKESELEIKKAESKYEDYKSYDWSAAFIYSAYRLEQDLFDTDLSTITELKIPIYLFLGRHDWNLPTVLSTEFLNNLACPKKEIVWFENSGHEPLVEEASIFNHRMLERIWN